MREQMVGNTVVVVSSQLASNEYRHISAPSEQETIALPVDLPDRNALMRGGRVYTIAESKRHRPSASSLMFDIAKRLFDLIGSAFLILLLSPIFVITAIGIYLESGPQVIFKQKRSSCRGGSSFDFYKFRSMVHGADEMKDHLQGNNESDGALFKIRNDPRITRVGRIIRRLSMDELPQLFNVLKGDMSLVGPRPLPVSDLEKMQGNPEIWRTMRARATVKPGVTGLWQVCGRSTLGFSTMITLDLYYVENRSLLLDTRILLQTIPAVLRGEGAC